ACGTADGTAGLSSLGAPAGVDDGAAVARPGRVLLEVIALLGQRARFALGQILDVEPPERLVHDLLAVGGHVCPAQHLRAELRGRDVLGETQRVGDAARALHAKRDDVDLARGDVDAADLAPGPVDDGARVGSPGHLRVDAVDGPRLLQVALEAVGDDALGAARDVGDHQRRLAADPAEESQALAVGRRRRAAGPAGAGDERFVLGAPAVVAMDDVDLPVGVLVVLERLPRRVVLAVVEVAPVGRERRLAGVLLVGLLLGDLDALAAAAMPQPDLARAQRALGREVLAADEKLAVGRPGGAGGQAGPLRGGRPWDRSRPGS